MSDDDDIPVATPGDDGGDDDPFDSIGREPTQGEKNVPDEVEYTPCEVTVHWHGKGSKTYRCDQMEMAEQGLVMFRIDGAQVGRMMGMEAGVHKEKTPIKIIPYEGVKEIGIKELETETVEVVN
jgi:hypothetical protein